MNRLGLRRRVFEAIPFNSRNGIGEFARGKEPPLSLLLSVSTDVYRLRSASTEPRVIAVTHSDSRSIALAAREIDLSIYRAVQTLRGSNCARLEFRAAHMYYLNCII